MKECSKSIMRRLAEPNFINRYFRGEGIDIGGAPDPLALYVELFPLMRGVRIWDIEDGDGQTLAGVPDGISISCIQALASNISTTPRKDCATGFACSSPADTLS